MATVLVMLSAAAADFADSTSDTVFLCLQVALAAGKRTAWIDKGPYYEVVQVRFLSPTVSMPDSSMPYMYCFQPS